MCEHVDQIQLASDRIEALLELIGNRLEADQSTATSAARIALFAVEEDVRRINAAAEALELAELLSDGP